jgi:hypothetical protein
VTKDGRPSRLSDIRLFAGSHGYLNSFEGVVAFARRLAWYLNSEDFSIGAPTHLYVSFSPSTPLGKATIGSAGMQWWSKFAYVGVPRELTQSPETERLLEDGIVLALLAARPDKQALIESAAATVREHGRSLRFLLKVKETKAYCAEVSFTIGEFRKWPTQVHVLRLDKSSGAMTDAPPINVIMPEEARAHVAEALKTPLQEYQRVAARPLTTKLVKFLGLAGVSVDAG